MNYLWTVLNKKDWSKIYVNGNIDISFDKYLGTFLYYYNIRFALKAIKHTKNSKF